MENSSETHPLARGVAPEQAIIAQAVLDAEARPGAPDPAELAQHLLNDLGNARRLIQRHGGDLVWVDELGWLVWDGTRWSASGGEAAAMIRAQMTSEAIFEEAATYPGFDEPEPPEEYRDAHKAWRQRRAKALAPKLNLQQWALESGSAARCRAMLAHAAPHLRIEASRLDADPWRFNVLNGTIELRNTRALFPHRRSDWITRRAAVTYELEADCPRWEKFVSEVLPDPDVAHFVHKWLGYCLCGDISEQKMVLFEGKGANGKSTMLEVVARILGDYAAVTPIETFLHQERRSGSGPSPDIARLRGARLVRASEPEPGARLSESTIKQFTGGEKMTARQLHRDFFEFSPQGKLTLSVNIRPVLVGKDHGIRRRILVVPFTQRFEAGKGTARGATLVDELMQEASGILNWLIQGFGMWLEDGLDPPRAVTDATHAYFTEMDPIGSFVREALRDDRPDASEPASDVYDAYKRWCRANNEDEKSQTAFGRRLADLGIGKKTVMGRVYYCGVAIDEAWRPGAAAASGAKEDE